jgi:hypothetical protein
LEETLAALQGTVQQKVPNDHSGQQMRDVLVSADFDELQQRHAHDATHRQRLQQRPADAQE